MQQTKVQKSHPNTLALKENSGHNRSLNHSPLAEVMESCLQDVFTWGTSSHLIYKNLNLLNPGKCKSSSLLLQA